MSDAWIRWTQALLSVLGIVCVTYVVAVTVETARDQSQQNARLEELAATAAGDPPRLPRALPNPDAATETLTPGDLVGRIDIDRLGLSAVIRHGDDAGTLRVAVGHLPGTPRPGEPGNAVLAAHRDTFFRPLRDVEVNDVIELTTPRGTYFYEVTKTHVVDPDDVWVMNPTEASVLTLVTCYPFTFIGHAPRRFIVHATKTGADRPGLKVVGKASTVSSTR